MTIYAVANNKGGVGKTHTVFHLTGAFAELGRRVLAIDLDPQCNLTGLLSEPGDHLGVFDVLNDGLPVADAVRRTPFENVWLLPGSRRVQNLDAAIGLEVDGQLRLADALAPVIASRDYDIVILDCPPSLGIPTRNALAAAHFVIIPLEADKFSADGVAYMHQEIERTKRINPSLHVAGGLVSLYKGRRAIEQTFEEAFRRLPIRIFKTRIKDSVKYREAIVYRRPITDYKRTSEEADAFRHLISELELNPSTHART